MLLIYLSTQIYFTKRGLARRHNRRLEKYKVFFKRVSKWKRSRLFTSPNRKGPGYLPLQIEKVPVIYLPLQIEKFPVRSDLLPYYPSWDMHNIIRDPNRNRIPIMMKISAQFEIGFVVQYMYNPEKNIIIPAMRSNILTNLSTFTIFLKQ
jgi:transposase